MKTSKIFLLTALAATASLTSCGDDFLDKTPENAYVAENYYTSDNAVMKAIEPLYNYAWFNYNYRAMIGMGSARANDGWNPYLNAEFATFQVTGLSTELANAWSSFYMVISMSNQLIADINRYCTPAVSKEVKDLAIGEAYLMRGVAYFYLVRSWGEVIVYEDNEVMTSNPMQPLTVEEDVLKFAIRDFERAAALLPTSSTGNHATKYAAEALLAKALLAQSGWNKNGTRDADTLERVKELCRDIIENGPYDLMDNYEDLYKYATNNYSMSNKETVLAMHFADPTTAEWGSYNANYSDLAWNGSSDVNVWGGIYASIDMIDFYNEEPQDPRINATFCTPGAYYDYWDTGNDLIKASEKTEENGYPNPTGYLYTKKHMQLKKWVVGTKADCGGHLAQMASPLNTYIMRYADVYLILAEACLGNDEICEGGEGVWALNEVRGRANLPEIKSFDLERLIRERRVEFCMDFSNWYDMVTWYRWKPQYMLNYFNNKQHRAYMLTDGDILKNDNGTFSYCTYPQRQSSPWYTAQWVNDTEYRWWNDGWRTSGGDPATTYFEHPTLDEMSRACDGFNPVVLSEANIFMPYPEADVLRNPYFNQPAQHYNFGTTGE